MRGLKLLLQASWKILGNLGTACRISLPWTFVAIFAVFIFIQLSVAAGLVVMILLWTALIFILAMCFISVAISWHRFSLCDEKPRGLFHLHTNESIVEYGRAFVSVTARSVMVSIACFLPIILVLFAISFLAGAANIPATHLIVQVPAVVLYSLGSIYVGTMVACFSIKLPAASMMEPLGDEELTSMYEEHFVTILSLAFFLIILDMIVGFVVANGHLARFPVSFGLETPLVLFFAIFANWFLVMLHIGYVTELYKYLKEHPLKKDV